MAVILSRPQCVKCHFEGNMYNCVSVSVPTDGLASLIQTAPDHLQTTCSNLMVDMVLYWPFQTEMNIRLVFNKNMFFAHVILFRVQNVDRSD